jgi:putative endonuclease
MKNFCVYILECSDGLYYTGLTADLERRLNEHQSGFNTSSYTYKRRPVKLVYYTIVQGYEQAAQFEKQLKDWSREKKKALIEENWEKLKEAAECKNNSSHKLYYKNVSTTLDEASTSTPLDEAQNVNEKYVSTPLDETQNTNKKNVSTPLDEASLVNPFDKTKKS